MNSIITVFVCWFKVISNCFKCFTGPHQHGSHARLGLGVFRFPEHTPWSNTITIEPIV
jgi:hypothetical protein